MSNTPSENPLKSVLHLVIYPLIVGIALFYLSETFKDSKPDCFVPDVRNLSEEAAIVRLMNVGITPVIKYIYIPSLETGLTVSQSPSTGTKLDGCSGEVLIDVASIPTKDGHRKTIGETTESEKAVPVNMGLVWAFVGMATMFVLVRYVHILDIFDSF